MTTCDDEDGEVPQPPTALLQLGDGARRVSDADEEVFILYTLHPAPAGRTGLGSVDSQNDLLTVSFELDDDQLPQVQAGSSSQKQPARSRARSQASSKDRLQSHARSTVERPLYQDCTSLRSTDGDTGSVVWRSSLRLGACLARQLHRPPYGHPPIINRHALGGAKVLELGSGTGVLPAVLLPYLDGLSCAPKWIASDQEEMTGLLRKNAELVRRDSKCDVVVRSLDWVTAAGLHSSGTTYAGGIDAYRAGVLDVDGDASFPDLLVAVDCVFNPSLFTPLVQTLDLFTQPSHTLVLVVIELRSSDATMYFLETWLALDSGWQIWALPPEQLSCGLDAGYAAWVGWKT
ncbi:unnamed protein product [Parajaminaea phylloscopi]